MNTAIKLTDDDFRDLSLQAQQRGEQIWQPLDLGGQSYLPKRIGTGSNRIINLRNGLVVITIRQCQLWQPLHYTRQHGANFPLVAKFYLSGASQVRSPGALHIAPDYAEIKGHQYLYHLPNQAEIEEWSADEPIHVISILINPSYLDTFDTNQTALPPPLQKLIEGDRTQRFHQSLGPMTLTIKQLLHQVLHCPYTGLLQQIYLESKALELLATQFALWTETSPSTVAISLCAQDIEQLYQAREILMQQITDPPSLLDLARQVGLNDYKLKRGFRQLFGTSAFDYLRDYRLQQAKTLLQNPSLTISRVAATVGYKSPEAFCHAFRRKFGITPKAYQLSQQN
ncbi:MAG: AraC family transcriptional regulator [Cyanobacteria bacterium P01_H01_bin.152]